MLLRIRFCILALLLSALAGPAAITNVFDPFTDGNRTNATGGDTQGLVWYLGQTTSTLYVTNDSAGIGSGNALQFTPQVGAGFGKYLAYFGPITLSAPGDSITLTFSYRFTSAPTNINAGFRVGLYNTLGTRQTTDASDTGSGAGNRSDDVGYGFQTNPGTNQSTGTSVYSEASTNDILGGASPSQTANVGTAGTSVNSDVTPHTAMFQISRQPNGDLALSAKIDAGATATATIAAASVFTNTFDEVGFSEGGTGFAVPWLLDNVIITSTAADDFDKLRVKWWEIQTGGTNYNLNDSLVKSRLSTITNTARGYWNSMDKTGTNVFLWSDLTNGADSAELSTAYSRLRAMALAWTTYGSGYRSNSTLAADIQIGLNWMYTNRYNLSTAAPGGEYDNWYDWEIGAPLNIADIGVFMYDALGMTGLSNTLNALDHFVPSPFSGTSGTSTGGNLTDKIRSVGVRGATVKDASKVAAARDAFSSLFTYVTSGDGYYADGSFVQHTRHPYNGSYGLVCLNDTSLVLPWLENSPWECTDPAQTNVMNWIYESYEPFLYYGAMMDMTRGRAMSRYSSQDHTAGASIMLWILTLAYSPFPPAADASRMKSIVKYLALRDTFRTFTNNVPLQLIPQTEALMADAAVIPRGELFGHWTFAGMDQSVHLRPGWGCALSLSSSRIYNYESINSENLHGWFQGDGATYFYTTNDLGQFSEDFWPTVDPYKLTGTTVDLTPLGNAAGQSSLSSKNWVGGATLGTNGTMGLDLDPAGSPLTAKKSWFMLDDEVICLGAGITCSTSTNIQTTALTRKLSNSNTNILIAGGVAMPTTLGWQTNFTSASWCALSGFGGCYFPGGANVKAIRESRTNSWSNINAGGTTGLTNRNYLSLWFDHGIRPTNANYSYVILPGASTLAVSNYALAPEVTILENTTNAQAVKETTINVVAANFWTVGGKTIDLITVSNKSAVMTQEDPATLSVAVADPTQTNNGSLFIGLNRAANSVAYVDPGVTILQLRPTIKMTVATAGTYGRSLTAKFNLQNSPPSITPIPNTNLNAGITMTLLCSASDPDQPWQTLSFSLTGPTTNANINSTSGQLTWRPSVTQAGKTNPISVVVSDDGSPILRATQTFNAIVPPLTLPTLSQPTQTAGHTVLSISGSYGPDYAIQVSSNLLDWTPIFTTNQPAVPFLWSDPSLSILPQRYYRVTVGP